MQSLSDQAAQAGLAQQYAGLVQSGKPEPLVTLGHVVERHIKIGENMAEAERKLASIMEHVSGLGASYGDPAGSDQAQPARSGMVGRMRDRADQMEGSAERMHGLLNSIMTHLGMNEPTAMGRSQG